MMNYITFSDLTVLNMERFLSNKINNNVISKAFTFKYKHNII